MTFDTPGLSHDVYWGDAQQMHDVADGQVHLIVTSPPYWQLKDYGVEGQIGFHDSYEDYIQKLNRVWGECHRVLNDGCRMCVNIGDQFARAVHYGRYKVIPLHAEIIAGCEAAGFDYMGSIIWQKSTTMNTSGGGAVMGSFPHPRNGIVKIDYEFILIFKKLGKPPKVTPEQKAQSTLSTEEWNQYFSGHWNFAGEKQGDGHLAMFPVELPRRLIRMFSFPGETVLDPFLGSGTTLRATIELNRRGLGYEINQGFETAIRKRIGHTDSLFPLPVQFRPSVAQPASNHAPMAEEPAPLSKGLERQVDSREYRFNSIMGLDDFEKPREKGLRVREIIAPDCLRLQDNSRIRLLGIKPLESSSEAALQFLREKVLNQQILLKFDTMQTPQEGHLAAYVYLANKTFVNAKLLRLGLVAVDPTVSHPYAAHFQSIIENQARDASHV